MMGRHVDLARMVLAVAALATCMCHRAVDTDRTETAPDRVTIIAPRDWASFMVGDDIPLEATVQTQELVQRLEFWANGGVISTLHAPPYRTTIHNAGAGGYRVHAVAHTAAGRIASPAIRVSVMMREEDRMHELTPEESMALVGGAEPKIVITSPKAAEVFHTPADILIDTWIVPVSAPLKSMTVLGDEKPLVTLTKAPFKHVWRRVPPGKHIIAVRATDTEGRTSTVRVSFTVG
jgi:hypothetical protein